MTVFQIDPDKLLGFQIDTDEEYPEHYYLYLLSTVGLHTLHEGSFDKCHAALNELNKQMNNQVIDLF